LLSEVVMARQPEVFVRSLEPEEAQRLVRITRTTKDRVRLRRAGIVLASVQGRSAAEAAGMFAMKPQYAREVIHAFNEQGFAALDPKWSGGRPKRFGPPVREMVCRVAKTPPQQLGRPFITWSLTKLVEYLAEHKAIAISAESVRQILRKAGIRWQATKTWKASKDPDFAQKMARVLDLYDHPPADGRVICAELDRMRVHRPAILHPRRQRLPPPHRPRERNRRLHPLAQQARQTQTTLRARLQDPPTRLPTQRCLTRH
jgi:transposase